jgi:TRAP-type C4-dicarboxylate transport system substrate-binding protein
MQRSIRTVSLAALVGLLSLPGLAAVEVKAGSVAPEGTPWEEWLKSVESRMEKESGGELSLKLYLGGKLGGEKERTRRSAACSSSAARWARSRASTCPS